MIIVMLLWAILGHPPYGFFTALKFSVATVSVVGAWAVFQIHKMLFPLSGSLCILAMIFLFGHMKREDWLIFDWIGVGLLGLLLFSLLYSLFLKKQSSRL
jgi:hypothetical protein